MAMASARVDECNFIDSSFSRGLILWLATTRELSMSFGDRYSAVLRLRGRSDSLRPKRIDKLRQKPFQIIRHVHAVFFRELVARQIKGPEHPVNKRKEYRVIFVVRRRIRRVMPMMKLRRRNKVLEKAKFPVHVR